MDYIGVDDPILELDYPAVNLMELQLQVFLLGLRNVKLVFDDFQLGVHFGKEIDQLVYLNFCLYRHLLYLAALDLQSSKFLKVFFVGFADDVVKLSLVGTDLRQLADNSGIKALGVQCHHPAGLLVSVHYLRTFIIEIPFPLLDAEVACQRRAAVMTPDKAKQRQITFVIAGCVLSFLVSGEDGLNVVKGLMIYNGGMFSLIDFAVVPNHSQIKLAREDMANAGSEERRSLLGPVSQTIDQLDYLVDRLKLDVFLEDELHQLHVFRMDCQRFRFLLVEVSQRNNAAVPKPLLRSGEHLVFCPLRRHLPFELGKVEHDVAHKTAGGG